MGAPLGRCVLASRDHHRKIIFVNRALLSLQILSPNLLATSKIQKTRRAISNFRIKLNRPEDKTERPAERLEGATPLQFLFYW